jgi:CRP/FNR family transcriptional regulator, cyclic AMP receptor protein
MKTVKKSVDFQTLIRRLSPFCKLSTEAVSDLEKRFFYRRYAPGVVILGEMKKNDDLFLIRSGSAQIILNDKNGRNILLHSLSAGDIFGRPLPTSQGGTPTSVTVVDEVGVLVLSRKELAGHMSKFPETSLVFMEVMAARLEETYETMACLSLGDVSSRFMRLLSKLARNNGTNMGDGIMISQTLTQSDMAQMIGARRETISRLITQFVASGIIKRRGRSLILAYRPKKK